MRNSETHTETMLVSTPQQLYDLVMLEEMDDQEYLVEILDALLDESPRDLKDLRTALEAGNTGMVCKKAHKLKSSAGVIQAERLTTLLACIENEGKSGTVTGVLKNLVEDAVFEYNRIERSLQLYIQSLK